MKGMEQPPITDKTDMKSESIARLGDIDSMLATLKEQAGVESMRRAEASRLLKLFTPAQTAKQSGSLGSAA